MGHMTLPKYTLLLAFCADLSYSRGLGVGAPCVGLQEPLTAQARAIRQQGMEKEMGVRELEHQHGAATEALHHKNQRSVRPLAPDTPFIPGRCSVVFMPGPGLKGPSSFPLPLGSTVSSRLLDLPSRLAGSRFVPERSRTGASAVPRTRGWRTLAGSWMPTGPR